MKENKTIFRIFLFTGIVLIFTSLVHALDINDTLVAVKTGDIAASHAANTVIMWIFSGVCMFLLGIWVLFLSADLKKGRRKAWWQAFIISISLGTTSFCCWLQYPRAIHVLFFLILGLIMLIPLLLFTGRFKRQAEPGPGETTRQTPGL